MSSSASDPSMEPTGLVDDRGSYVLNHEDIYKLLRYVWTGVLIATTPENYKERLGINKLGNEEETLVQDLVNKYKNINKHCTVFKDETYPSIVSLADTIYSYAQNAGGSEDSSFYANILKYSNDLFAELQKPKNKQDASKIQEATDTVNGLVDAQLASIEDLRRQAKDVVTALRTFEGQCKADQEDVDASGRLVLKRLEGEDGEISRLKKDIEEKRKNVEEKQAEYEKDVIVACTSLTYAWIFPVGTVIAGVIIGVYSDKAIKLKEAIDAMRGLIKNECGELEGDQAQVVYLHMMDNQIKQLLELIGPAIHTIQKMIGCWDAIAGDLQSIKTMVADPNSSTKGNNIVRKLVQKNICKKWDALAKAVDNYRQIAYVSDPEKMTLEEYGKKSDEAMAKQPKK